MNQTDLKNLRERYRIECERIATMTDFIPPESPQRRAARIKQAQRDYPFFVQYYFPHYAISKCGKFHNEAAKIVLKNPTLRGVFQWARGHAKSTHFDIMIPLWLKCQRVRQLNVMVLVGKSEDSAITLLSDLQAELEANARYIADFGKQQCNGGWEDGQFVTQDNCAFFARGRGQSPRGLRHREHRPDYIVIDDLDDDELCQNPDRVHRLTQWVKEALFGTMDAGRGRFIMVGNLISKNSVLAAIAQADGVTMHRVNIIDSRGRIAWPEHISQKQVDDLRAFQGYRSFEKEYMNNPITSGAVFDHQWIHWGETLPWEQYDQLVAYCDPSFKSSSKNDYKAIKLWGSTGTKLHHLAAFVRQCSTAEMVRWLYDLHERMPPNAACAYYMEANFMQDIILDEFAREGDLRGYQLPIAPDRRKKPDKFQRIESISPLWERGFVRYDATQQLDRDTLTGIDQLLAFEKGSRSHDDAPDADEGAIYILRQRARQAAFRPILGTRKPPTSIW